MPWQPLRLPRSSSAGFGIARLARWTFVRALSSNALAGPNIATLLAIRPSGESESITAVGSVRTVRNQKQRSFVEIGDGSTVHSLQALLQPAHAQGLGTGTLVAIKGQWRVAPRGKEQPYELEAEDVEIIGTADPETYPIQKKYQSTEYLRTIPHLRLRTPGNALLARLKSECDFHLAEYFRTQGFVRVQPPIITSSDCEGAGEVFRVSGNTPVHGTAEESSNHQRRGDFFRDPKFLTVSSQLHLEAFVHEHPKVWTLSPTFRAEKSDTPRHVSEFWMLEAELRTASMEAVMNVVEQMLSKLVNRLRTSSFEQELTAAAAKANVCDIDQRQRTEQQRERWDGLTRLPYPRITYSDAIKVLQTAAESREAIFQHPPLWERGLQLEHEKYIAACIGEGSPVFVTDYPAAIKPFYMLPNPPTDSSHSTSHNTPNLPTASCFDLLLPDGTEVAGGSMREHRLEQLTVAMAAAATAVISKDSLAGKDLSSTNSGNHDDRTHAHDHNHNKSLEWYLDLRRHGSVPHGGFGLGFDRLVGWLAGVGSVRDVVAWPRYYGRCEG